MTDTASSSPRVPNVHAHAVSGLDHVALGDDDRDALNVSDQTADLEVSPDTEAVGNVVAPSEELPDMTGAVASSEPTDDTSGSAPQPGADADGFGGDAPEPEGGHPAPNEAQDAAQQDGGTGAPATPADGSDGQQAPAATPDAAATHDGTED